MRRPVPHADGIRTASGPHLSPIFYPPFLTAHFYLLITWLILKHIPESLNPNIDETQSIVLDPRERMGTLLKFRVQETRKGCTIFIEMEEVLYSLWFYLFDILCYQPSFVPVALTMDTLGATLPLQEDDGLQERQKEARVRAEEHRYTNKLVTN